MHIWQSADHNQIVPICSYPYVTEMVSVKLNAVRQYKTTAVRSCSDYDLKKVIYRQF